MNDATHIPQRRNHSYLTGHSNLHGFHKSVLKTAQKITQHPTSSWREYATFPQKGTLSA